MAGHKMQDIRIQDTGYRKKYHALYIDALCIMIMKKALPL